MFDTIAGLPLHPLVIHVVVVFAPLTALALIGYAASARMRVGFLRWALPVLALITGVSGFVAGESGEKLEHRLESTETDKAALQLIHQHAQDGDRAKMLCLVLMVIALVVWFVLRERAGRVVARPVAVLCLVASLIAGGAATYQVVVTGHSGAKSAWADVVKSN